MYFYSGNYYYLFICIITLVFTYLIKINNKTTETALKNVEKFGNYIYPVKYVYPTKNNPFMNPTLEDYKENPIREAISKTDKISKQNLKKEINDKFNINLYKDLDDVFDKNNSQRQFYTVPVTTIPNEQTKFADWLYNTPETCKEGNGAQCVANNYSPLYTSSNYYN